MAKSKRPATLVQLHWQSREDYTRTEFVEQGSFSSWYGSALPRRRCLKSKRDVRVR
jgi:hypothetical protein